MKILYATSEAVPYFKSGGLGDVSRSLPDALAAAGNDVRIILPLYAKARASIDRFASSEEATVPWPGGSVRVRYAVHRHGSGAPAVLVEQPAFFEGGTPYQGISGSPFELGMRFALFCRAVVRYAHAWNPDIIHLNDWTTGFVPVYALVDRLDIPTVFAIHNLGYQGNFPPLLLDRIGVPWDLYRTENGVEFLDTASFLKAGIALSDRLVTVSPTYAREIQTAQYGAGLDGLLRFRRRLLTGILNGIDHDVWDPGHDPHLAATYTASTLDGKESNRDALLSESGLDGWGPLFAIVGRLVAQKGVDLVVAALPALLESGARLVILGEGDRQLERGLARVAANARDRIASFRGFDEALAHRIYAGADFFLMPSRYEPCGLGQMIAQRYGTPPVARHTGGIVDTVTDRKTGFVFDDATPQAVAAAVRRASASWRVKGWDALCRRCMRLDWSWARSAEAYEDVYRSATA